MNQEFTIKTADIASRENVLAAIDKAVRGKGNKAYIRDMKHNREAYADKICALLRNGDYQCAKAHTATRTEKGKERHLTYTADPVDIIVRFVVTMQMNKVLLPKMHPNVCANIEGKGNLYCINTAKGMIQKRKFAYYLCEDVRKYFAHIDKEVLLRIIKEESNCEDAVLDICHEMLSLCDEGVSIGTYDSQLWANVYLMQMDRFITERYPNTGYLRYCDNVYVFGDDVMLLHRVHRDIANFAKCIKLKMNPCLFGACKDGCRVLSMVIFPTHTRLRRRIKEAMRRSMNVASYFSHLKWCNSINLIRNVLYKKFKDLTDIPEFVMAFAGDKYELAALVGKRLIVTDCVIEESKFCDKGGNKRKRAKIAFKVDGRDGICFSSSQNLMYYCEQFLKNKEKYLPVELTINKDKKQYKFEEYVEQD